MKNLSSNDRIFFAKRLSFLVRASIPLHAALETLTRQSKKSLKKIFEAVTENVNHGQGLAASLAMFPKSFPEYMICMIEAGEESGTLGRQLALISSELHRRRFVARKLASSLLYPVVVALGTVALSFFLVLVIFPKVKKLFQGLKVPLPLSTRILLWLSDFIHVYGLLMLILIILIIFTGIFVLKKYPEVREEKARLVLSLPIVGGIVCHYSLAAAFRTASIMLASGISIEKALVYAGKSLPNLIYRNAFENAAREVSAGGTLHIALQKFPKLFPDTSVRLIEIGEASGTLSETLSYLSEMLDEENEDISKALLSIVEPALMAIMGLVVGFISLSIITPIYAITQNISR